MKRRIRLGSSVGTSGYEIYWDDFFAQSRKETATAVQPATAQAVAEIT
jgi:hypothetical protein